VDSSLRSESLGASKDVARIFWDRFFASQTVTGLGERDSLRAALRTTMIKRANELQVFEELFDVYFTGLGDIIKGAARNDLLRCD
jgi:uncharacterized protein with von Willebrand factor type A (vWA) domain